MDQYALAMHMRIQRSLLWDSFLAHLTDEGPKEDEKSSLVVIVLYLLVP